MKKMENMLHGECYQNQTKFIISRLQKQKQTSQE